MPLKRKDLRPGDLIVRPDGGLTFLSTCPRGDFTLCWDDPPATPSSPGWYADDDSPSIPIEYRPHFSCLFSAGGIYNRFFGKLEDHRMATQKEVEGFRSKYPKINVNDAEPASGDPDLESWFRSVGGTF